MTSSKKVLFEQKIREASPDYKKPGKPPKVVGQREWTPTENLGVGAHSKDGYLNNVGGEGTGPPPPKKLSDLP